MLLPILKEKSNYIDSVSLPTMKREKTKKQGHEATEYSVFNNLSFWREIFKDNH